MNVFRDFSSGRVGCGVPRGSERFLEGWLDVVETFLVVLNFFAAVFFASMGF